MSDPEDSVACSSEIAVNLLPADIASHPRRNFSLFH